MNAGRLNRRIQIQSLFASTELDSFRQPTASSWVGVYDCWASIDIQNSQLIYSTAEFMSKVAYRITIRYPSVAISANQRVVYTDAIGTHTYVIQAVLNDKAANRQLTIMCYDLADVE